MGIISFSDLHNIRREHRDKKIVLCSGTFDLIHAGHVLFLEECKKLGDILVVGIGNDHNVSHYKKGRPVLNELLRAKLVSSLKPVDYCYVQPLTPKEDEIVEVLNVECETLKPDMYVVNNDIVNIPRREEIANKFNVKMIVLERWSPPEFGKISTSQIIQRIRKKDT